MSIFFYPVVNIQGATGPGGAVSGVVTTIPASDINCSLGNFFKKTITGPTTLTISNITSQGTVVNLELTNAANNVTWPANVNWANNVTPTFTTVGIDVVSLVTFNSGGVWHGSTLVINSL